MSRSRIAFLLLSLVSGCGKEAPKIVEQQEPPGPPTLSLSTVSLQDTIGAVIATPVTVRLRRPSGPIVGASVVFAVAPGGSESIAIAGNQAATPGTGLSATTDATGSATAYVTLRTIVGNGVISVSAPAYALSDTVRVAVTPGRVVRATILPRDTTVFVGGSLSLRFSAEDRMGNAVDLRPDVVSSDGLSATSRSETFLAGSTVMRGRIILRHPLRLDTVDVTVMPRDTLLFLWLKTPSSYQIAAVGLDGTIAQTFGPSLFSPIVNPAWSPDRTLVVSNRGGGWGPGTVAPIMLYDRSTSSTVLAGGANPKLAIQGHFSSAGDWIYFKSITPEESTAVWRVHPNGSALESLIARDRFDYIYAVYPVPGGQSLIIVKRDHGFRFDIASRSLTDLGLVGQWIAVSPSGEQIAWEMSDGALWIANIDGTQRRRVGNVLIGPYFAWTRDPRYLFVESWSGAPGYCLLDTVTGAFLPVAWAGVINNAAHFTEPSARP